MGKLTLRERFEKRVTFPSPGVAACWTWSGYVAPSGYGTFQPKQSQCVLAHRLAYELFRGPIPDGMTIDHLCRNRRCVNPDHMEVVTRGENTLRARGWAGINAAKTHCPKGHPYDEANTYKRKNGQRGCRACMAAACAKWQAKTFQRGPANGDKTHCRNGHEYNETNTLYGTQKGGKKRRTCRICSRISRARSYRRSKAR